MNTRTDKSTNDRMDEQTEDRIVEKLDRRDSGQVKTQICNKLIGE